MTLKSPGETYMQRCLDLALHGLGYTAPNPLVGSVIVYNDKIIGEGYHQKYGGSHAEVNAINSVTDKSLLEKSTLYVNLEPCSHTGKTPPCADLIIMSRIPTVVAGITDPNPLVSGMGFKKMTEAGISVTTGLLADRCTEINKRFITFHKKNRPYVILKLAQTKDHFIDVIRDTSEQNITWISNELSRMLVHKWRSEEQSILIGTRTAIMDNPRLTVREWQGKSPVRLVIDKNLKLPKELNLFDHSNPTIVFNALKDFREGEITYVCLNFDGNLIENILDYLFHQGIQSVLVEGGKMLIEGFLKLNLWDEARVFTGPKYFNQGVPAPEITGTDKDEFSIREDRLMIYRNHLIP
jgi:diaminohydroxyphosphoribosylaminopyrimidine deaminase/5-amino-6-(5-phosphoribosylamino)uracil reductase